MMKNVKTFLFALLISLAFVSISCSSESDDEMDDSFDFSTVADGEGLVNVSGEANLAISGVTSIETFGTVKSNPDTPEEKVFNIREYKIEDTNDNIIFIDVYWPEADGEDMPEGSYTVTGANLANFPSDRFIVINISVDEGFFATSLRTSGTANVANTGANFQASITFDVEDLETSFDETFVNAVGGANF